MLQLASAPRPPDASRSPLRIAIVGGGVLGTMLALAARRRAHDVTHLERDLAPRGASVRNFGAVWVSGRAEGRELELALRSRERWGQIAEEIPAVRIRPDGSLTLAQTAAELEVLEAVCARDDADARGVRLLSTDQVRTRLPEVRGRIVGGMECTRDAIVDASAALAAIRAHLAGSGYRFLAGHRVRGVDSGRVRLDSGDLIEVDLVFLATGADWREPAPEALADAPLRRCRLQMLETAPWDRRLGAALADGDSLRYYPAYRVPALANLPAPAPVVAAHCVQMLMTQRETGALTIGDTHVYDEPFDFALDEAPLQHLVTRAQELLGTPIPPIVRRWAGVYAERTDEELMYRQEIMPGVIALNGLGGRGMTMSAIAAEDTFRMLVDAA